LATSRNTPEYVFTQAIIENGLVKCYARDKNISSPHSIEVLHNLEGPAVFPYDDDNYKLTSIVPKEYWVEGCRVSEKLVSNNDDFQKWLIVYNAGHFLHTANFYSYKLKTICGNDQKISKIVDYFKNKMLQKDALESIPSIEGASSSNEPSAPPPDKWSEMHSYTFGKDHLGNDTYFYDNILVDTKLVQSYEEFEIWQRIHAYLKHDVSNFNYHGFINNLSKRKRSNPPDEFDLLCDKYVKTITDRNSMNEKQKVWYHDYRPIDTKLVQSEDDFKEWLSIYTLISNDGMQVRPNIHTYNGIINSVKFKTLESTYIYSSYRDKIIKREHELLQGAAPKAAETAALFKDYVDGKTFDIKMQQDSIKDFKNKKKESKMSQNTMPTFGDMLKQDAEKSAYRSGANQGIKALKAGLSKYFDSQQMDKASSKAIIDFFESDLGEAAIRALLGYGLTMLPIPGIQQNEYAQKVSEELRVSGLSKGMDKGMEMMQGFIVPALTSAFADTPMFQQMMTSEKHRLPDDQSVDVDMDEEEKEAPKEKRATV